MNNATLSWQASAQGTPTGYTVVWNYNGTALAPQTVPTTATQNTSGYSVDFASSNPSITVKAGDVIGASVQAVDTVNNLSSDTVTATPPTVTIPATPPVPPSVPQNVQLVLS